MISYYFMLMQCRLFKSTPPLSALLANNNKITNQVFPGRKETIFKCKSMLCFRKWLASMFIVHVSCNLQEE